MRVLILLLLLTWHTTLSTPLPRYTPENAHMWLTPQFWQNQELIDDDTAPDQVDIAVCLALAMLKNHQTSEYGINKLSLLQQEHSKKIEDDWIFWESMGGVYGAAARRILAESDEDPVLPQEVRNALHYACKSYENGWRARMKKQATRQLVLDDSPSTQALLAAYPQRIFDRMPSQSLRLWGIAAAWLGDTNRANSIYETGVSMGIWSTPMCRPEVEHRLIIPPGAPRFAFDGAKHFNWIADPLLKSMAVIRSELNAVLASDWLIEQAGLHSGKSWTQLPLIINGNKQNVCDSTFFGTCRLLDSLPFVKIRRGQVKFSRMQPGTTVRPHAGPVNERLRMHCTISTPSEPFVAWLRVGTEYLRWKTDECFVFDESCEHEVEFPPRPDDQERIVLIVDIANPFMTSETDFTSILRTDPEQTKQALREYRRFQRVYKAAYPAARSAAGQRDEL